MGPGHSLTLLCPGDLLAYDVDREVLAPFKVPCLLAEQNPKSRHVPIVSLQFHPRDIGKVLIGYMECAVIYSFKQNVPKTFLQYHVPAGAPGGDANHAASNLARNPLVTQAVWHPTGTCVLTGHDDGSLVVWDSKEGRMLMARTLTDTNIDKPGAAIEAIPTTSGKIDPKTPLIKMAWCANQDPDDTGESHEYVMLLLVDVSTKK